jgi:cell division protein FtsN
VIKLIPLIIFPLSFFLIFLGVKNLTGNFPSDNEKITHNDKEEIIKYNQNPEDIEKKIVKETEQNFVDVNENLTNTKEIEKQSINEVKESENNGPLEESNQRESNSKKSKETNINIPITEEKKDIYFIQFGAFSKKKNAEDLKSSVMKKINTKFPDFFVNIDFDEKKKLYKLISQTNDLDNAKKVCNLLKEVKINCLFKKQ